MQVYLKWRRWTWLVDINGKVIARVHPRWWWGLPLRRIFTVMEKIGDKKIGNVAYVVEVSQEKDEKILYMYKPTRGSTFAQLFNDAVAKEIPRKPMKRFTWSNKQN